jgi:hypothetical protein
VNESPLYPPQDGAARILTDALERDPSDRESFIAEACGGDRALLEEVTGLLAAHDAMPGQFLDAPAATIAMQAGQRRATSKPSVAK